MLQTIFSFIRIFKNDKNYHKYCNLKSNFEDQLPIRKKATEYNLQTTRHRGTYIHQIFSLTSKQVKLW